MERKETGKHSERGATEIARPDIARPSNLWGQTSPEWTTWHQFARVENARPAVPDHRGGHHETK